MEHLDLPNGSTEGSRSTILERLEALQREIEDIKKMIKAEQKPTTLRGILKGINISDEDIEQAKRSWDRELDDI